MARVAVAFACICALLAALPASQGRGLQQSARTSCKASSSATLSLVGSGSGRAKGSSLCQAQAEAVDAIETVVTDWCDAMFNEQEGCSRVEVEGVVQGFATAYAKVLTEVQVEAEIIGSGTACASGRAEGDAIGGALLDVAVETTVLAVKDKHGKNVSEALAEGIEEKVNEGSATASAEALAVVVAEAWAAAYDALCTEGGAVASIKEGFAEQITTAYADLWAYVAIQLCQEAGIDTDELKDWQQSMAESDSLVQGTLDTTSVNTTRGDATVSSAQPLPCAGKYEPCCATNGKTCNCGVGCTARRSTLTGNVHMWTSETDSCFCV